MSNLSSHHGSSEISNGDSETLRKAFTDLIEVEIVMFLLLKSLIYSL